MTWVPVTLFQSLHSPRNVRLATGSLCLSPFSTLGRWVALWRTHLSMFQLQVGPELFKGNDPGKPCVAGENDEGKSQRVCKVCTVCWAQCWCRGKLSGNSEDTHTHSSTLQTPPLLSFLHGSLFPALTRSLLKESLRRVQWKGPVSNCSAVLEI